MDRIEFEPANPAYFTAACTDFAFYLPILGAAVSGYIPGPAMTSPGVSEKVAPEADFFAIGALPALAGAARCAAVCACRPMNQYGFRCSRRPTPFRGARVHTLQISSNR